MTPRPSWHRDARTVDGREVTAAELQFAAEVGRLGGRLATRLPLNGFVAWRLYRLVRAGWERLDRLRRSS